MSAGPLLAAAPRHVDEEVVVDALRALASGRPMPPIAGPVGEALAEVGATLAARDRAIADVAAAALEAQDRSDQANAAKSAFLANMSHELRTPLNAILGFGELIVEEHSGVDGLADDVTCILDAGRHLLELLGDILDLARVEAGRFELDLQMVDIAELVESVGHSMRPVAEQQGNELVIETSAQPLLLTDGTKLRQVLINLIGNAAKFTEDGRITVSLTADAYVVRLAVHDTGCGIAPDRRRAVFDPFTQEEADTFVHHGGTGLGLAITRRYCQLLGGDIHLSSIVGTGSVFTVELPRPPEGR